jgi:hypothetical protein
MDRLEVIPERVVLLGITEYCYDCRGAPSPLDVSTRNTPTNHISI